MVIFTIIVLKTDIHGNTFLPIPKNIFQKK
jgi:hypothetical protein